jgi:hypothetical protein
MSSGLRLPDSSFRQDVLLSQLASAARDAGAVLVHRILSSHVFSAPT